MPQAALPSCHAVESVPQRRSDSALAGAPTRSRVLTFNLFFPCVPVLSYPVVWQFLCLFLFLFPFPASSLELRAVVVAFCCERAALYKARTIFSSSQTLAVRPDAMAASPVTISTSQLCQGLKTDSHTHTHTWTTNYQRATQLLTERPTASACPLARAVPRPIVCKYFEARVCSLLSL